MDLLQFIKRGKGKTLEVIPISSECFLLQAVKKQLRAYGRPRTKQSPFPKVDINTTVEIPSGMIFHQNFLTFRYDWVTRYNGQRFLNTNLPNKTWNLFR